MAPCADDGDHDSDVRQTRLMGNAKSGKCLGPRAPATAATAATCDLQGQLGARSVRNARLRRWRKVTFMARVERKVWGMHRAPRCGDGRDVRP